MFEERRTAESFRAPHRTGAGPAESWTRRRRAGTALLFAAVAALAQGCGGSDGDVVAAPAPAPAAPTNIQAAVTCASLATLQIPNVTITAAQAIPAGTYQPPGSPAGFSDLPAFCRVTATSRPVPGSATSIELWLPAAGWNGRYQQVGTHGFGGTIFWSEMAPQLQRGFVTAAGDSGHVSTGGFDGSWAFGAPERITDFASRSVHEVAVNAKQIIQAYYKQAASYSYHNGCSTGGREGMMAAQKYPSDFNGILAGGSIQHFTRSGTQMLFVNKQLLQSGFTGAAGSALLAVVQKAAVAACDSADGVTDGIIRDPRTCRFDPRTMICTAGQAAGTCLTPAQADAVAASIAPMVDPVTHQTLFVGQTASSQSDWARFGLTNGPFAYPLAQYQIGLNDPAWNSSTFDMHRDLPLMENTLNVVNATNPDLSAFRAAGGKIIQYHGWEDGVIMPEAIVQYYDEVRDRSSGGDRSAQLAFHRLFMMPGVSHCGGGAGPYNFGQEGQTAVSNDAAYDAVTALQAWVEAGSAPAQLIATRFKNNDVKQGIDMQRPICPYPTQAVYKGTGDSNSASSFSCQ